MKDWCLLWAPLCAAVLGCGADGGGEAAGGPAGCARLLSPDSRIPADLGRAYLDIHNKKRAQYCLPPLTWDEDLARVAQAYAERGAGTILPHNANRSSDYAKLIGCTSKCPYIGENITWATPYTAWPLDGLANGWLAEESKSACNQGGGHYTQMVWEQTTRVGCGMYIDSAKGIHFICDYLTGQSSGAPFAVSKCGCGGADFAPATTCS